MYQQIKHETGHVQFRVLREKLIGQNSLQLSGSTPVRFPERVSVLSLDWAVTVPCKHRHRKESRLSSLKIVE